MFSITFASYFYIKYISSYLQYKSRNEICCTFLLEPERALEIYEQAIKKNPRDSQLAAKMGQVND